MATAKNTNREEFSRPTGQWSAVPTHASLLRGTVMFGKGSISLEDEDGDAYTTKPNLGDRVFLKAKGMTFTLTARNAQGFTGAAAKQVLDDVFDGTNSYSIRLHSGDPGTNPATSRISGGGYADLAVTAFTTAA